MKRTEARRQLLAVLLALSAGATQAQAPAESPAAASARPLPASYAVISELAREVNVVSFTESTGSRIDQNQRQRLPVPDGALDKVALLAVQKALKQAAPAAGVWLIAPAETDFFSASQSFAMGDVVKMPADLAAALKDQRSSHLLLLSRFRSEAEFRFDNMTDGKGQLQGLGFFVERRSTVIDRATETSGTGFLAPFVYLRMTLIDAQTFKVLNSKTTKATRLFGASRAKDGSGNPWETLTSAEKMNTLRDMLMAEVQDLVPKVLAAP